MAYFHTTVLDNQIKALPTVSTASGSVATFDTDLTENLIECVCDIQYTGTGEGTPTDPNYMIVYNSLNLSHSGSDTSNPTITNIPFGFTTAKAVLNITNGVMQIIEAFVDLGTVEYQKQTVSGINLFRMKIGDNGLDTNNILCSHYKKYIGSVSTIPDNYIIPWSTYWSTTHWSVIRDDSKSSLTPAQFKTAMSGVQLVYDLSNNPIMAQIPATQVQTLLNENNIWCDTNGDTSVKYLLSIGKKIS